MFALNCSLTVCIFYALSCMSDIPQDYIKKIRFELLKRIIFCGATGLWSNQCCDLGSSLEIKKHTGSSTELLYSLQPHHSQPHSTSLSV